jgi:hypothetical protein
VCSQDSTRLFSPTLLRNARFVVFTKLSEDSLRPLYAKLTITTPVKKDVVKWCHDFIGGRKGSATEYVFAFWDKFGTQELEKIKRF